MADRFYHPLLKLDQPIVLEGDEARHLARVSRKRPGDVVELFDGRGTGISARVLDVARDSVDLELIAKIPERRPLLNLHLFVSPPKGDRFDWLVEQATEIGVASLTPLKTARSVVDPRSSKLDRLRRVIIEASKQSGRSRLMELNETITLDSLLRRNDPGPKLIAHLEEVPERLKTLPESPSLCLAIGPEGGWTVAEVNEAKSAGWLLMPLGATRLRVETAAIVGAATVFQIAEGVQR